MHYEVKCLRGNAASGAYEVVVLSPRGKLWSLAAVDFGQELQEVCRGRYPYVLVDMAEVSFLDSCGIGSLFKSQKVANERGVILALASLQSNVQLVADLVALDKILEIYADTTQFMNVLRERLSESPR